MGTGRFGAGGSGALGRGGSGARVARSSGASSVEGDGGNPFFTWRGKPGAAPAAGLARDLVRDTFAQRNVASYTYDLITSASVKGCYADLAQLSSLLAKNEGWSPVEEAFGIGHGLGCLADLLSAIETRNSSSPIEAHREVAAGAVLDVLSALVGDDEGILLDGDARGVLAALDKSVLDSLSSQFLGTALHRALLRELPALVEREGPVVREAMRERADFIVANFEADMKKGSISHRDLIEVIAEHQDWFESHLRQVIA
jgi:hypothetical protein